MIRLWFLLIEFCVFAHIGNAQNLLPNPSFDEVTLCIPPNSNLDWNISEWPRVGDIGTADPYNVCNDSTFNSSPPYIINPPFWVPYSIGTFQYPHSGEGFVGYYCGFYYNMPDSMPNLDQSREYITALLNEPMLLGKRYCVGGWMNNMNVHFAPGTDKYWTVYTNQASVGFHSSLPNPQNASLFSEIDFKCRLTKEDSSLIIDTLNWEHVRTPYTASGNEKFAILGNLYSDTASGFVLATNYNIDSLYQLPPSQVPFLYSSNAYFYFDDMYVVPIQEPQIHVALSDAPGFVWLIDTTYQEERSWYKTGDDLVLGNGDSLYLQVSDGSLYTLHTRNCRVELSDTMVIDLSGLEKLNEDSHIRLFPNPCHGTLNVDLQGDIAIMHLFSITGQLLLNRQILSKEAITLDNIGTGTYVVQIMTESGTIKHEKLVIIP